MNLRHGARSGLALALSVFLVTGCLSSSHRIPQGELMALSQQPPEERGRKVRVEQGRAGDDPPPSDAPRVQGGASVYVSAPIWVGGTPRHRHRSGGSAVSSHGGTKAVSHGGSSLASSKKDSAKVWLVIAAIAATALVFTEGIRYDGWVELHPMHPVHLWGPYGEYTWMPLAHVTPDVAAWSHRAVVRPEEGPWQRLGRAPLNRQGFTYSLLLGGGEIAMIGADPRPGFLSHIQLGYFFTHAIGLQGDIAWGWTDDDAGATVFDGRYSLELDFMPVAAGPFFAGVFGQVGVASRSDDGVQFDDSDTLLAGGGALQLELTTTLALTLRAGLTRVHDESLSELTFGVSIY